nr:integrase, catalytic region, zinc finger, CCHC-type, peptidase aspartic, catalytic [Tanacetum cinerariifolium]
MLNKDNYVRWSSCIIRYARSRQNGKTIVDSVENGPYVRRMIATLGEPDLPVPVSESFHKQTDEELTENDIKRMDADDQVIQTILLGLPEDVYAAVDVCETAKEIWERVRQMMKGNKHFPENIAANLKFLNNLQPEWKRHVTIVRQKKNLREADFTQIYDFLKINQDENAVQNAGVQNGGNQNGLVIVPGIANQNEIGNIVASRAEGIQLQAEEFDFMATVGDLDEIEEIKAFILFAKAFQLTTPTNNNQRTPSNPHNHQIAQSVQNTSVQNGGNQIRLVLVPGIANQNATGNIVASRAEGTGNGNQARCYNSIGLGHIARNCTARPRRRDAAYLQTHLLIAQKEEAGIQLQREELNFMAAADKAPVYDIDGSDENDKHVASVGPRMVQSGGTVETSSAPNEAAYAHQDTIYRNLIDQVTQIFNLNKQLSKEKSTIFSLMEEMKRLKHDFKTREDKYLDKKVDLEAKVKDLENIMLKRDQTVQTMHMLNPKPDSFYHPDQKMALGYPNPSYLKKAQLKQQSLYNGNLLLEEHDPPAMYDSKETLELAQKSREKMRFLNNEIKPANYAKINHLSGVFVPQTTKSKEELFLSNVSNMGTVSKPISIPNEDLSDDNTSSVARKLLNEVHKIISHEIAPIINQVDARVENFEIQFLQEAAKYVRDFKSLAKEADESLDKQKSLELEIERLLKASVSHDIMSIAQNGFVDVPSDIQTELDPYNDTQQKVKWLQAQLRDLKGKSSDSHSASNTLDLLNQKLDSKIVELEFQVVNYECEISHPKTTYKNLFNSITSNRAHAKLHNLIYKNAKLRAWLFENTSVLMNNTSGTSVTSQVDKPKLIAVTPYSKKLHASISSHSVPQPREFNAVKHRNVIAPGMFKIDPSQTSMIDLVPNNQSWLVHTARTKRPQPKGNSRNSRVPSPSKSSEVKKNVTIEDHRRILLLSKNQKTMSSECNNIKLAIRNDKYEIICGCPNLFVVRRLELFQAYDREHQASHQLCVEVFGTVRFGNDHIATILGYGDLKWGNITITRVYFVEGLGHNLFLGKSKRASYPPKPVLNSKQQLHLLHMDFCGPMRVVSINGKRHALVIVDDYSRYTWVHFLRTKDETPKVIKNVLKKISVCLQAPVIIVHTDNITEFKNHALKEYFDSVGITHETSSAKTPQQNGVVKRRNRTLVEASKTMLIFSHALLFLLAEAIAIACYTQNHSIIHRRFNKTPYELIQGRKPDISYLHVFGALCYPKNDREDVSKLGAKGDIGFFIGYYANFFTYRVYNRRTKKIMETMNITFDELSAMAFEQNSSKFIHSRSLNRSSGREINNS